MAALWLRAIRVPLTWQRLVMLPGNLGDQRRLTKTHLAHPLAKIVVPFQFAYPTSSPGGQLAKRVAEGMRGGHKTETEYQN